MRSTFATAPSPPATSLARWLPARYFSLASPQRLFSRPDMPIATSTSALRRLVAARSLRRAASPMASRGRPARHEFGDQGQRHQDDGADQRGDADQPVEGEADRQIEGQPRQIEERARPHAAEERADIVEIAQRLQALVAAADHQRQPDDGLEHAGIDGLVERGSDPPEDASAQQVEHALGDVEAAGEHDEADQGRHAAARQHPVIDLQHEDRAGQVQQVDHATHEADADERVAAGAQRFTEFGTPDTGSGCAMNSVLFERVT